MPLYDVKNAGEIMTYCPASSFSFGNANAVVVRSGTVNAADHLILNVGNTNGFYFHVAELYDSPRCMDEAGYQKYLKSDGMKELARDRVSIPDPVAALQRLEQLLGNKWMWGGLPNTCSAFVIDVLSAGGSFVGHFGLLPAVNRFD
ncbi:MAG TPA: hypothetical protein VMS93_08910 [Candidatus Saccharimonadales bacterium]|nr:hypothetical protein [Candidatus Saccharimonadales bacterium]